MTSAEKTESATVLTGGSPKVLGEMTTAIPAEKTETATVLTGASPKAKKVAGRDDLSKVPKAKEDERAPRTETVTSVWDWLKKRQN